MLKVDLKDGGVISQIIEKMGLKKVLLAYDIEITGDISGKLQLRSPSEANMKGKTVTVLYEQNGRCLRLM